MTPLPLASLTNAIAAFSKPKPTPSPTPAPPPEEPKSWAPPEEDFAPAQAESQAKAWQPPEDELLQTAPPPAWTPPTVDFQSAAEIDMDPVSLRKRKDAGELLSIPQEHALWKEDRKKSAGQHTAEFFKALPKAAWEAGVPVVKGAATAAKELVEGASAALIPEGLIQDPVYLEELQKQKKIQMDEAWNVLRHVPIGAVNAGEDIASIPAKASMGGSGVTDWVKEKVAGQTEDESFRNFMARQAFDQARQQDNQAHPDRASEGLARLAETFPEASLPEALTGGVKIDAGDLAAPLRENALQKVDNNLVQFFDFLAPGIGEEHLLSMAHKPLSHVTAKAADLTQKAVLGTKMGKRMIGVAPSIERVGSGMLAINSAIDKKARQLSQLISGDENALFRHIADPLKPVLWVPGKTMQTTGRVFTDLGRTIDKFGPAGRKGLFEKAGRSVESSPLTQRLFGGEGTFTRGRLLDAASSATGYYTGRGIEGGMVQLALGVGNVEGGQSAGEIYGSGIGLGVTAASFPHTMLPAIEIHRRVAEDADIKRQMEESGTETEASIEVAVSPKTQAEAFRTKAVASQAELDAMPDTPENKAAREKLQKERDLHAAAAAFWATVKEDDPSIQEAKRLAKLGFTDQVQQVKAILRSKGLGDTQIKILTADQMQAFYDSMHAKDIAASQAVLADPNSSPADKVAAQAVLDGVTRDVERSKGVRGLAISEKDYAPGESPIKGNVVVVNTSHPENLITQPGNFEHALAHELTHALEKYGQGIDLRNRVAPDMFAQYLTDPVTGEKTSLNDGLYTDEMADQDAEEYLSRFDPVTRAELERGSFSTPEKRRREARSERFAESMGLSTMPGQRLRRLDSPVQSVLDWLATTNINGRLGALRDSVVQSGKVPGLAPGRSPIIGEIDAQSLAMTRNYQRALRNYQGQMLFHVDPKNDVQIPIIKILKSRKLQEKFKDVDVLETDVAADIFDMTGKKVGEITVTDPAFNAGGEFVFRNGRFEDDLGNEAVLPVDVQRAVAALPGEVKVTIGTRVIRNPDGTARRLSDKESKSRAAARGQAIREALDNAPDVKVFPNAMKDVGGGSYRGVMTPGQLAAIKALPELLVANTLKRKIFAFNQALGRGDGTRFLINYQPVYRGGKARALSPKFRDVVPIGFQFSKDGNFLTTTASVSRMFDKLNYYSAHMPDKLAPWAGDQVAFVDDLSRYLQNHAAGLHGEGDPHSPDTMLARDMDQALAKKNVINDFLNMFDKDTESANPVRTKIKAKRGQDSPDRIIMSARMDRITDIEESSAQKLPIRYDLVKHNFMPGSGDGFYSRLAQGFESQPQEKLSSQQADVLAEDDNFFTVTPSAKDTGKWQRTEWQVEDGQPHPVGDSEFSSRREAAGDLLESNWQKIPQVPGKAAFMPGKLGLREALESQVKEEAEPSFSGRKAWLSPDGEWVNVYNHADFLPREFDGRPVSEYDAMRAGFVRVVNDYDTLFAEHLGVTNRQARELADTAAELGKPLGLEGFGSRARFMPAARRSGNPERPVDKKHYAGELPKMRMPLGDDPNNLLQDTRYRYGKVVDGKTEWIPERVALHDEIFETFLKNGTVSEHPTAYLVGGPMAAGKTTLIDGLREAGLVPAENEVTYVNPDAIKELLPEMREFMAMKEDRGATAVHEESSELSKELMRRAVAEKRNILWDASFTGGSARKQVQMLKDAGYTVKAFAVQAPVEEAIARAQRRAVSEGRGVPMQVLLTSHKLAPAIMETIPPVADFFAFLYTDVKHYDRPGLDPVSTMAVMLTKEPGKPVKIVNKKEFTKFSKNSLINTEATTYENLFLHPEPGPSGENKGEEVSGRPPESPRDLGPPSPEESRSRREIRDNVRRDEAAGDYSYSGAKSWAYGDIISAAEPGGPVDLSGLKTGVPVTIELKHGTPAGDIILDPKAKDVVRTKEYRGKYLFATTSNLWAVDYAAPHYANNAAFRKRGLEQSPTVIRGLARFANPLVVDTEGGVHRVVIPKLLKKMRAGGHDGLILLNVFDHSEFMTGMTGSQLLVPGDATDITQVRMEQDPNLRSEPAKPGQPSHGFVGDEAIIPDQTNWLQIHETPFEKVGGSMAFRRPSIQQRFMPTSYVDFAQDWDALPEKPEDLRLGDENAKQDRVGRMWAINKDGKEFKVTVTDDVENIDPMGRVYNVESPSEAPGAKDFSFSTEQEAKDFLHLNFKLQNDPNLTGIFTDTFRKEYQDYVNEIHDAVFSNDDDLESPEVAEAFKTPRLIGTLGDILSDTTAKGFFHSVRNVPVQLAFDADNSRTRASWSPSQKIITIYVANTGRNLVGRDVFHEAAHAMDTAAGITSHRGYDSGPQRTSASYSHHPKEKLANMVSKSLEMGIRASRGIDRNSPVAMFMPSNDFAQEDRDLIDSFVQGAGDFHWPEQTARLRKLASEPLAKPTTLYRISFQEKLDDGVKPGAVVDISDKHKVASFTELDLTTNSASRDRLVDAISLEGELIGQNDKPVIYRVNRATHGLKVPYEQLDEYTQASWGNQREHLLTGKFVVTSVSETKNGETLVDLRQANGEEKGKAVPVHFMPSSQEKDPVMDTAVKFGDGTVRTGAEANKALNGEGFEPDGPQTQAMHSEIFLAFEDQMDDADIDKAVSGFITKSGKFLDRKQAFDHAIAQKQIDKREFQQDRSSAAGKKPGAIKTLESFSFDNTRRFMPSNTQDSQYLPKGPLRSGNELARKSAEEEGFSLIHEKDGILLAKAPHDTPEWKQWFGKSKLVDESGAPIVFQHRGSLASSPGRVPRLDVLDPAFGHDEHGSELNLGFGPDKIYFSSGRKSSLIAQGEKKSLLYQGYLSMQNPFDGRSYTAAMWQALGKARRVGPKRWQAVSRELDRQLKTAGYDGIYDSYSGDAAIFYPGQFKLSTNKTPTSDARMKFMPAGSSQETGLEDVSAPGKDSSQPGPLSGLQASFRTSGAGNSDRLSGIQLMPKAGASKISSALSEDDAQVWAVDQFAIQDYLETGELPKAGDVSGFGQPYAEKEISDIERIAKAIKAKSQKDLPYKRLYRGLSLQDDAAVKSTFPVNKIIETRRFQSAGVSPETAADYADEYTNREDGNIPVRVILEGDHQEALRGVPIEAFEGGGISEVILPPGEKFMVYRRIKNEDGSWDIYAGKFYRRDRPRPAVGKFMPGYNPQYEKPDGTFDREAWKKDLAKAEKWLHLRGVYQQDSTAEEWKQMLRDAMRKVSPQN